MIVILKQNTKKEDLDRFISMLNSYHVKIADISGEQHSIFGLIGYTSKIDIDLLRAQPVVADVKRVQEPYKSCNRKFHPEDTIVDIAGKKIGGKHFQVIAGPCSVENEDQIIETAEAVKAAGATMLRGGAFKPRTSPYAFQGLHADGIELLLKAKKATGMPIVTEIMAIEHLDLFADVDLIQVGARNMQNFELLKALGHSDKPILLKRDPLRTRYPHLRDQDPEHSGSCSSSAAQSDVSPAHRGGSQPRNRHPHSGKAPVPGCHCMRCQCSDDRGSQQPGKGAVRRCSVPDS